MRPTWRSSAAVLLFLLAASTVAGQQAAPRRRYRVEQVFRLETTTAEPVSTGGAATAEPVTVTGEGRVRFVLEQQASEDSSPRWRFTQVETQAPETDAEGEIGQGVQLALALGLRWMHQLDGKEFTGSVAQLPVFPLGESRPAWLTAWLRWAQTGGFSGVEGSPMALPASPGQEEDGASYELRWLRSDFRQENCNVQQARWAVTVQASADAVSPALAAEGVEARTFFSAQSLEWISQRNAELVYAERSGVRETFWSLEKVQKPDVHELVFRFRLAVQVRIERLR